MHAGTYVLRMYTHIPNLTLWRLYAYSNASRVLASASSWDMYFFFARKSCGLLKMDKDTFTCVYLRR